MRFSMEKDSEKNLAIMMVLSVALARVRRG
jgi:hypothetical protein